MKSQFRSILRISRAVLLVLSFQGCTTESNLVIANPEMLRPYFSEIETSKTVTLESFTGGTAVLSYSSKYSTVKINGSIDMKGAKTTSYPVYFDFVTKKMIVAFKQSEASNKITIIKVTNAAEQGAAANP